jgi:hypothetical protein
MFQAQIILNLVHPGHLFGSYFRAAALDAVFDGTAQRHFRIMDIHLDLRSIDIGIVA